MGYQPLGLDSITSPHPNETPYVQSLRVGHSLLVGLLALIHLDFLMERSESSFFG